MILFAYATSSGKSISVHGIPVTSSAKNLPALTTPEEYCHKIPLRPAPTKSSFRLLGQERSCPRPPREKADGFANRLRLRHHTSIRRCCGDDCRQEDLPVAASLQRFFTPQHFAGAKRLIVPWHIVGKISYADCAPKTDSHPRREKRSSAVLHRCVYLNSRARRSPSAQSIALS